MKCFYHSSDLDGHCAGAIVKLRYPECEMVGVNYNDSIQDFNIEVLETVFIVDFSFPISEMEQLNDTTDLHWMDHHKSSIEAAQAAGFLASGGQHLEIGKAGCELTWEYLHESKMPQAVLLLGRYDVWDHRDSRVLPFQYGMREHEDTRPESPIWGPLFENNDLTPDIIDRGVVVMAYQDKENAKYAKGMAYEAEFEGHRAIVMNKAYANSRAFDAVYNPGKHDIMVMFGVKAGEIKYTLYCYKPEVDVSKIAAKYGGGGHKSAAGFYSAIQVV